MEKERKYLVGAIVFGIVSIVSAVLDMERDFVHPWYFVSLGLGFLCNALSLLSQRKKGAAYVLFFLVFVYIFAFGLSFA